MRLRVLLPSRMEVDEEVDKVLAEGEHGAFCLLPRHLDMAAALTTGLLSFEREGKETFLAVDRGLLVKCGQEVLVSTSLAVRGSLGELQNRIAESAKSLDEHQAKAEAALEKIQADFVRRFVELNRGA